MKLLIHTTVFFLLTTQICFGQPVSPSASQGGWYQQNSGTTKNLQAVHFFDANNGWVVGDSGTIFKTTDLGNNWILQTSGTTQNLNDIQFINANTGWAVGGESITLKTTNGGTNWFQQTSDTTFNPSAVFIIDENTGWVVGWTYDGSLGFIPIILKTTNGGINWIYQSTQTGWPLNDVHFVNANIGFIAGGIEGGDFGWGVILKTTNGGDTWIEQTAQSDICWYGISFLDEQNGIIVGNKRWALEGAGIIFRTTDGGINWLLAFEEPLAGDNDKAINSVTFLDFSHAWAVEGPPSYYSAPGKILFSSDAGINWVSQGEFQNSLQSVCFSNSSTGWVVGQNGTILYTNNGGVPVELTSFTAISNGSEVILKWSTATETNNKGFAIERSQMSNVKSQSEWEEIGFVPGFGTTTEPKSYSFTDSKVSTGKHKYRLKQIDFDGSFEYSQEVEVDVSAPLVFSLEQNYPNPFNPSTKIKYSVPQNSQVQIKVFDVLGNDIETLVNEEKSEGTYELTWNAANIPSGVYFYQLQGGNYIDTKKMILLQ